MTKRSRREPAPGEPMMITRPTLHQPDRHASRHGLYSMLARRCNRPAPAEASSCIDSAVHDAARSRQYYRRFAEPSGVTAPAKAWRHPSPFHLHAEMCAITADQAPIGMAASYALWLKEAKPPSNNRTRCRAMKATTKVRRRAAGARLLNDHNMASRSAEHCAAYEMSWPIAQRAAPTCRSSSIRCRHQHVYWRYAEMRETDYADLY